MSTDFTHATHTLVLSDIHLADVQEPDPKRPLWKRFKFREHSIDDSFKRFLDYHQEKLEGPIELVLNGDIFDFDSVMVIPENIPFKPMWLERVRGLNAEEAKSRVKMGQILKDHPVWFEAITSWVKAGNKVVFVIGNHDMELHWPGVQQDIINHLNLGDLNDHVRFCEWFYISNQDTLIEHGNQYDAYCLCNNPINPLIRKRGRFYVRLPFGNLANKYVMNGMGLFNPHVDSSWIKDSLWEYVVFFYRHMIRVQPFLLFQWFWGAIVTMFYSITETLQPALKDPTTYERRLNDISHKANTKTSVVLALRELHVHPAGFHPWMILRELWLDRVILFGLILWGSFQIWTFFNLFGRVSAWVFWGPFLFLLPIFIFYSHSIESEVRKVLQLSIKVVPLSSKIAGVERVIHGHTHFERHVTMRGVEHLNTGTWSPAFEDIQCTKPYGKKCFGLITASSPTGKRRAELYEWADPEARRISKENPDEEA